MRILLVDDNEMVCSGLSLLLRGMGNIVIAFNDGKSALQEVEDHAVDLLISDIRMPGMNDLRLAHELNVKKPDLPVVLMSGFIDDEVREQAALENVRAILSKPLDRQELEKMMDELEIQISC